MELSGTMLFLLIISGIVHIMFGILLTNEVIKWPFFSPMHKTVLVVSIWLTPVIGLIIAYKQANWVT